MNQRFQSAEINLVSEKHSENDLYKAICTIGSQLETELSQFGLCPEECFMEVLEVLSLIAEKGEDIIPELDIIWQRKYNEYRRFDRSVDNDEIRKVVGIVLGFAILAIDSSRHSFYRYTLTNEITTIIANHKFESWAVTLNLIFSVPLADGWFDAFIDEEPEEKASQRKGKPTKASHNKQEKQHGVDYPVFAKGHGVTDNHIKAVYQQLASRAWISTQTSEGEFLQLFSGNSNACEIIWTGIDKLGNNKPTKLGRSALYVLFKTMLDEGLITSSGALGPILESHFVDDSGKFIRNVSNANTISALAEDVINNIMSLMRTRPTSENIQGFLQNEMETKYDCYDRQDMNYHKRH